MPPRANDKKYYIKCLHSVGMGFGFNFILSLEMLRICVNRNLLFHNKEWIFQRHCPETVNRHVMLEIMIFVDSWFSCLFIFTTTLGLLVKELHALHLIWYFNEIYPLFPKKFMYGFDYSCFITFFRPLFIRLLTLFTKRIFFL